MTPRLTETQRGLREIADVLDDLDPYYRRRLLDAFAHAAGMTLHYVPRAHGKILAALEIIGYEGPELKEETIRLDDTDVVIPTGPDPREVAAAKRKAREQAFDQAQGPGQTPEEQRQAMKRALRTHGVPMPR